jgi:hypothetical protein
MLNGQARVQVMSGIDGQVGSRGSEDGRTEISQSQAGELPEVHGYNRSGVYGLDTRWLDH